MNMTQHKKLIEVALPLDAINAEAVREKSIRHGHPSTLHLWWARRPLAACRAVLFASLVDNNMACKPTGIPQLFTQPEDFSVTSVNYNLMDLLKGGREPT
jgi:putative DNA methylase